MYKFERYRQLGPANFNQPVGFKMDPENRWVKKSETIPWDTIEEKYAKLAAGVFDTYMTGVYYRNCFRVKPECQKNLSVWHLALF